MRTSFFAYFGSFLPIYPILDSNKSKRLKNKKSPEDTPFSWIDLISILFELAFFHSLGVYPNIKGDDGELKETFISIFEEMKI